MRLIALTITALIALLHVYIAWFEIFAWTSKGPEIFSVLPLDLFEPTISMAANQGIYNGFLAAGLAWALKIKDQEWQTNVATCFLLFVAVAGMFGAMTITTKTLFIQTVPAVAALAFLHLSVLLAKKP